MEFPRETVTITFAEDTPWPGIVVEVFVDTPIAFFMWVRDTALKVQAAEDAGDSLENVRDLYVRFGDEVLKGWNIDRDGAAVPCTGEGLVLLSVKFGTQLMGAWTKAVLDVSGPLDEPSANGNSSAGPPTPPAPSSQSRGNSKKRDSSKLSAKNTAASRPS
tara:strand:+ start:2824 stop:3306 length:483 start_codon:yes stop_codon:yes gene_type:complete